MSQQYLQCHKGMKYSKENDWVMSNGHKSRSECDSNDQKNLSNKINNNSYNIYVSIY